MGPESKILRPNFSKIKKFQKNRFSKFKNMPLVVLNPEGELRGPMGSGIPRAGPHPEKLTFFLQKLTLFLANVDTFSMDLYWNPSQILYKLGKPLQIRKFCSPSLGIPLPVGPWSSPSGFMTTRCMFLNLLNRFFWIFFVFEKFCLLQVFVKMFEVYFLG